MKRGPFLIFTGLVLAAAVVGAWGARSVPQRPAAGRMRASLAAMPLYFEEGDRAQAFTSRGAGYALSVGATESTVRLRTSRKKAARGASVRMRLLGASPKSRVAGERPLPGKVNYLIGDDPAKWRRNVSTFEAVRARGVYPGVDLVHYGTQGRLEYDFVVAPGADPGRIRLAFDGADAISLSHAGDLVLHTAAGDVVQNKPVVYQEINGERHKVAASFDVHPTPYTLHLSREIAFHLGEYDRSRTLVIDPSLVFSTFLGGRDGEGGLAVASDPQGNVYVTGATVSSDFPVDAGAFDAEWNFGNDAFVAKIDPINSRLVYATFLGGGLDSSVGGDDYGTGIAVDDTGAAYVTGLTNTTDFPKKNAAQATYGGGAGDAFITKLNPAGTDLVYSTYLGGSGLENSNTDTFTVVGKIALDESGNAYVAGLTSSTNFPTADPFQDARRGVSDAFVASLSANGTALRFSTYLGGAGRECFFGVDIAVHDGSAYVTGDTRSTDFPVQDAIFPTDPDLGAEDAFVTQLSPSGSTLEFSTYLGGESSDQGTGIAVGADGSVYVVGHSSSVNFPVTLGAFQVLLAGSYDVYAAKINSAGSELVYCTLIGGLGEDFARGVAVGSGDVANITGSTDSTNFPVAEPIHGNRGGFDAFVCRLSATGAALPFSTYLGGNQDESDYLGGGIALDPRGNILLAGFTKSTDFPLVRATQTQFGGPTGLGEVDAFVAKISDASLPAAPTGLAAATVSAGAIDLSWTDQSDNEEGFEIQRKRGSGAFARVVITAADAEAFGDSDLDPATTYSYRVRAVNLAGVSEWAGPVTATTLPLPPTAPANVGAATLPTDTSVIRLAWTDTSDNEDGYIVTRTVNGGGADEVARLAFDTQEYLDSNTALNTTYVYTVRAFNTGGESAAIATEPVSTIAAPSGLTATLTNRQVVLAWQDQSVTDTGVNIERAADKNHQAFVQIATVPGDVSTFTDENRPSGKNLAYRVRGVNQNAQSEYSNVVTIRVPRIVASLTLKPNKVTGGKASTATVTLDGPAPKGGLLVTLKSSDKKRAKVPAMVTVLKGKTSATFKVTTKKVNRTTEVTIAAALGDSRKKARLVLRPAK
jgi:hypothetical protein